MQSLNKVLCGLALAFVFINSTFGLDPFPSDYQKKRLIISTDIGGGDKDDTQSMIHFLAYANMFDLEGIVISRPKGHISEMYAVLDAYAQDYDNFKFVSEDYPTPNAIRKLVRIGASRQHSGSGNTMYERWRNSTPKTPRVGYSHSTPGSRRIVAAARRDDPRPLYVICWGSTTDVAQAVHDDPSIVSKLIVVAGGTGSHNYNYVFDPAPMKYLRSIKKLRMIDGAYGGGLYKPGLYSKRRYGNVGFVSKVIAPRGELGKLFYKISGEINVNRYGLKMGDTTTLLFVMTGDIRHPERDSWAGSFCRVPHSRRSVTCPEYGDHSVSIHRRDILKDWETRLQNIYDR